MRIDLTDGKPITPEMVAAVAAGFDLERRTGTDRRDSTRGGGRRAADHKPTTPDEVARIARRELQVER